MVTDTCSLREKKHARTKLAIMKAFMQLLRLKRFDDISIREVCRNAEIAEGTFFNYFPEKIDVIRYYLHMHTLKMIWKAQEETPAGRYLSQINSIFDQIAEEWKDSDIACQIFSVLMVQKEKPKMHAISAVERVMAFPECHGIEKTPAVLMDQWFRQRLVLAQKSGQLPSGANVDDVVISLMTIIAGTLLALKFTGNRTCSYHYTRQLNDLWLSLGAKEPGKAQGARIRSGAS